MSKLRAFASIIVAGAIVASAGIAGALTTAAPAWAENCASNPHALGTSRTLAVDPREFPRIGLMQYRETLPLADKEVVLTFDDGPLPRYSDQVLEILAAQCVKVTYFLVGRMAHEFPDAVRRAYAAGHTIGTHSENHPLRIQKMPVDKIRQEIDGGIASVVEALGDPNRLAPFFRIPGLLRTDVIESELSARGLVTFSADVVADDWHRHISASEIVRRAITRLEARGKGILLLHDIHPATVAALPVLLKELKERGYHVVHVVPADNGRIETAGAPDPVTTASTTVPTIPWVADQADPNWSKVAAAKPTGTVVLPAPEAKSFDPDYRPWRTAMLADHAATVGPQWPDLPEGTAPSSEAQEPELPAPGMQDLGIPFDGLRVVGEAALRPSLAAGDEGTGATTPSQN